MSPEQWVDMCTQHANVEVTRQFQMLLYVTFYFHGCEPAYEVLKTTVGSSERVVHALNH